MLGRLTAGRRLGENFFFFPFFFFFWRGERGGVRTATTMRREIWARNWSEART